MTNSRAMEQEYVQAGCAAVTLPATPQMAGLPSKREDQRMTDPNPPAAADPFQKRDQPESGGQPYGQPYPGGGQSQYGQPQYGQSQPPAPGQFGQPQYQQVPPGYYPVFNSQGQQVLVPLASPGKRFGVYLLDALLVIVTLVIGYLIWLMFTWQKGQTPGKSIAKLKYVNTSTGAVADWGKSALRDFVIRGLLVGVISSITFYIGFLVMAFMIFDKDKNYQAGWDRIAGTVVVDVSNVQLSPLTQKARDPYWVTRLLAVLGLSQAAATTLTVTVAFTSGCRRTEAECAPTILMASPSSTRRRSSFGPPALSTASTTSAAVTEPNRRPPLPARTSSCTDSAASSAAISLA
jgi:uncharacterized RDD family membrane protein YckC